MSRTIPLLGALPVLLLLLWLLGAFQIPLIAPIKDYPGLISGHFYDAQAWGVWNGTLAVPCWTLQGEAFIIGGRCYGYFGITPSLLRIPPTLLCPSCAGQLGKAMMLAAGLLSYAACVLLARAALAGSGLPAGLRAVAGTGFALLATVGGTLTYIAANPRAYHEAILWGGAFALIACWAVVEHLNGRRWALPVALGAVLLTLNARVTMGLGVSAGVGLALAVPFLRGLPGTARLFPAAALAGSRGVAAVGIVLLAAAAATPFAVHQIKFGQLTPPMDKQGYYAGNPARLERIKNGMFRPANAACTASAYLSPATIRTQPRFPWVAPAFRYWDAGMGAPSDGPEACADSAVETFEATFSLWWMAPAPLALAFAGLFGLGARREWVVPLLGAAAAAVPVFLMSAFCMRYLHDFFPLLAVAGAPGLALLAARPRALRLAAAVLLPLVLVGLHVNVAAVLQHPEPQPVSLTQWRTLQQALPFAVNW